MEKLVLRSDVLLFYGIPGTDGKETITRMTGFTSTPTNSNPIEKERTYTDNKQPTTDVTGYNKSVSFSFERYTGNAVHEDLIAMYNAETVGIEARRDLYEVDFAQPVDGGYMAKKRTFSVIFESAGDGVGTDAMVYSGTFKTASNMVTGVAKIGTPADGTSETVETITFTPSGE